jgi:hypothetical protein
MKIAFVGYGQVGAPLADHLQRIGHEVTLAAKDPTSDSVRKALSRNPSLGLAAPKDAVRDAEVVFLATPRQGVSTLCLPREKKRQRPVDGSR